MSIVDTLRPRPRTLSPSPSPPPAFRHTREEERHPSLPPARGVCPSPTPPLSPRSHISMDPLAGMHLGMVRHERTHPAPYVAPTPVEKATSLQLASFSRSEGFHVDPMQGLHKKVMPEVTSRSGAASPAGLHLDPLFKNHGRQDYEQKRRTPFNESVITGLVTESFGREHEAARVRGLSPPRPGRPAYAPAAGLSLFGESESPTAGPHVDPMHTHHRRPTAVTAQQNLMPLVTLSPRGSAYSMHAHEAELPRTARASTSVILPTEHRTGGLHTDPLHTHHRKYDPYYWRSRVPLFGNTHEQKHGHS